MTDEPGRASPAGVQPPASECENECSRLAPGACGQHGTCAVDYVVGGDLLFVLPHGEYPSGCPHLMPFGRGMICRCPTRLALHRPDASQKS